MNKPNVKRILSSAVANLRVSVLGVSFSLADLGSSETVDERIARLGKIKADLEAAIGAVEELQGDANASKLQVDQLRQDVAALQQDKATAEQIVEELYVRCLSRPPTDKESGLNVVGHAALRDQKVSNALRTIDTCERPFYGWTCSSLALTKSS